MSIKWKWKWYQENENENENEPEENWNKMKERRTSLKSNILLHNEQKLFQFTECCWVSSFFCNEFFYPSVSECYYNIGHFDWFFDN